MDTGDQPPGRKLIDVVRSYQKLLKRVDEYLQQDLEHADIARTLEISLSNYYSKRKGERRFTYDDIQKLIEQFGTKEEKAQYKDFIEVRDTIYNCLLESHISITQYRRVINLQHHKLMTRRRDHPDTWKVEDLEKIGLFMESIAHCIS